MRIFAALSLVILLGGCDAPRPSMDTDVPPPFVDTDVLAQFMVPHYVGKFYPIWDEDNPIFVGKFSSREDCEVATLEALEFHERKYGLHDPMFRRIDCELITPGKISYGGTAIPNPDSEYMHLKLSGFPSLTQCEARATEYLEYRARTFGPKEGGTYECHEE